MLYLTSQQLLLTDSVNKRMAFSFAITCFCLERLSECRFAVIVCAGRVCSETAAGRLLPPNVWRASVGPARQLLRGLCFQPGCERHRQKGDESSLGQPHSRWVTKVSQVVFVLCSSLPSYAFVSVLWLRKSADYQIKCIKRHLIHLVWGKRTWSCPPLPKNTLCFIILTALNLHRCEQWRHRVPVLHEWGCLWPI